MIGNKRYGLLAGGKVQCIPAVEDGGRTVIRVNVKKRADAFHRIGCVRQRNIAPIDFIIFAAHCECQPIARRHYNRGRPDFDVELDRLAGYERPFLVVAYAMVDRAAIFRIELAMRRAQPAEPNWHARIIRTDEGDLFAGWIESTQHQEQVGVAASPMISIVWRRPDR